MFATTLPPSVAPGDEIKTILDPLVRCLVWDKPVSAETMATVLGVSMRRTADALHAQATALLLVENTAGTCRMLHLYFSRWLYGNDREKRKAFVERSEYLKHTTLPLHEHTPVWYAINHRRTVFEATEVPEDDPNDSVKQAIGLPVRSIIAVPLVVGREVLGCILAMNKCGPDLRETAFGPQDENLLMEVASFSSKVVLRVLSPSTPIDANEKSRYEAHISRCDSILIDESFALDRDLLERIGEDKLRRYQVLPLKHLGDRRLRVAAADAKVYEYIQEFEIASGFKVEERFITSPEELAAALDRAFPKAAAVVQEAESVQLEFAGALPQAEDILHEAVDEHSAPIVRLANSIIEDAHTQRASDIHIEPMANRLVVRYRVDGVCRVKLQLPIQAHRPLVSRLKIMAELDIAERRLPQDGRIVFKNFNSRYDIDLRVSSSPMKLGESVVMRILDKSRSALPLDQLGFSRYNLERYRRLIRAPYGMILHCGPTGSGKSMSLYSALNEIHSPEVKILTAEDPIEYTMDGINQLQVHRDIGLTFASALRCFLRQDPDIILVGEIRDRETAQIAVEASLTGHLLFSTLHTNDAPSTVTRLEEIGIGRFLVASSLVCVCAQRLVRRLCTCRRVAEPNAQESAALALAKDGAGVSTFAKAVGCTYCDGSGYRGRVGVHELLETGDELRDCITAGHTTAQLKAAARAGGMWTLFEDGLTKVKEGITSLDELSRTIQPDEIPR